MTPFESFLRATVERATQEAGNDGSTTFEAQHLLLAIAAAQERTTSELLGSVGLDHRTIRDALDREFEHSLRAAGVSLAAFHLPPPRPTREHPKPGASARLALERGLGFAVRKRGLRPAHLLLGILSAQVGTVRRALALSGIDQDELVVRVERVLTNKSG